MIKCFFNLVVATHWYCDKYQVKIEDRGLGSSLIKVG